MSPGASNFVESTNTAFLFITGISVLLLVVITFLMIYFVIRYSKKRNPKAVNIHGNIPLEIAWTIIPTILVLIMFWFGWVGYKNMSDIPGNAYKINVTAQMWQFKFHYANGAVTDTLYVPQNVPVELTLKSLDVNHALFIPAFKVKKDVYANRTNKTWFIAQELGGFTLTCAEYCGMNHSYMRTRINVLRPDEFKTWLASVAPKDTTAKVSNQTAVKDTMAGKTDSTNVKQ